MTNTNIEGVPPSPLSVSANPHFTDNGRKGRYGVAYLRSLAAHAGVRFNETSPDEDVDAIDVALDFGRASAKIQIKCSAKWKVNHSSATLQLKPEWIEKWTENYEPTYVVLVKVPSLVGDWIEAKSSSTVHRAVAFGKRFDSNEHTSSMKFTEADRLTSEMLYKWRDEVYEFHERGRGILYEQ